VKDAAAKKRDQYMDFFKEVPLLNAVDAYGRSQVADALKPKEVKKGTEIIAQGPRDRSSSSSKKVCARRSRRWMANRIRSWS